jgi:predicted amidohydrolase YtcJ
MMLRFFAGAALAVAVTSLVQPAPAPDLVIVNARIFTGNAARPWAEAVRFQAGRIAAVGTTAEILASAGGARTIDAAGRLLVPGFNDAHAHPGAQPPAIRLAGPPAVEHDPTLDEVIARVRTAVPNSPAGHWIFGEIGAAVLEDPRATRATLDPLTGDRPLMLGSWTGHGTIFNTAALRALGVGETEPDPPGGFFARMPDGRTLTGLAHEYAGYTLRQRLSTIPDRAAQVKAFQAFAAEAAGFGITSVQAMTSPAAEAKVWIDAATCRCGCG